MFGHKSLRGRDAARRFSLQRGITLLEVLVSIGVLSIGLLGVSALVPLALYKSQQGISNDRKSVVGRRAFREFRIRAMNNPGTANNARWLAPRPNDKDNFRNLVFGGNGQFMQRAYCIDPYYLAATDSTKLQFFGGFPSGADASCYRVSLARQGTLGSATAANQATTNALNRSLDLREASALFLVEDDLEVEIPKSATGLPVVSSTLQKSTDPLRVAKRYARGQYSWMATLVPQPTQSSNYTPPGDLYILSVAVFKNREVPPPPGANETETRSVNGFYSGGISGGDLQIRGSVKRLRVGNWGLLSAGAVRTSYLRWYRVVGVDEPDGQGNQNLMLLGPDWYPEASESEFTWVRNVVAVYEKTVRIKTRGY